MVKKDKLDSIRHETYDRAVKLIAAMKKKNRFDSLPLGEQKEVLDFIQEGLLDAADYHKTDSKSPA